MKEYPFQYYAIITGSRTGSTHLCDLLESTNRLGTPAEYFNPGEKPEFENLFPQNGQSYFDKIKWHSKKENFVVGVKTKAVTELYECFQQGMGDHISHWIWLRRNDKIAQAVSRYIAWKTNIWVYTPDVEAPPVEYNKAEIEFCLETIYDEEKWIELFLRDKHQIAIEYETDVCSHPEQTIISLLEFLQVPTNDLPPLKSRQQVMSTAMNTEFINRFKAEYKNFNS